jgi:hypothetical protein
MSRRERGHKDVATAMQHGRQAAEFLTEANGVVLSDRDRDLLEIGVATGIATSMMLFRHGGLPAEARRRLDAHG